MARSRSDVIAAVVLATLTLPGLVALASSVAPASELLGLTLLVPGALLVGAERLSRPTGGPEIHDRQLDRIVAGLAAAVAVAVVAGAVSAGSATLGSMLVFSVAPLGIGVLALLFGTRRLWQQKAVPLLLLAAWPAPWQALVAAQVPPTVGADTVMVAGLVLALAAVVALTLAPRRRHALRVAARHGRPASVPAVLAPVAASLPSGPDVTAVLPRVTAALVGGSSPSGSDATAVLPRVTAGSGLVAAGERPAVVAA